MKPRYLRERLPHTVYVCYATDGTCLYVGMSITSNLRNRLYAHRNKEWWPEVARVATSEHYGRTVAMIEEAETIRELRPRGNIYHNHPGPFVWEKRLA